MQLKSSVRSSMSILDLKGISFKVILIGDSSVGKTTLIHKYIHGDFLFDYHITVGVDFSSKTVQLEDSRFVQLQIWDTCGQEVYKSVVSSFYRGAAAVFLVYAVNNRQSFINMNNWYENFKSQGSPYALIFLIGTKIDLGRQVSLEQAGNYLKKVNGTYFIQTSSLTGQNIDELFVMAADILNKNYEINEQFRTLVKPDKRSFVGALTNKEQAHHQQGKKKKKCCSS